VIRLGCFPFRFYLGCHLGVPIPASSRCWSSRIAAGGFNVAIGIGSAGMGPLCFLRKKNRNGMNWPQAAAMDAAKKDEASKRSIRAVLFCPMLNTRSCYCQRSLLAHGSGAAAEWQQHTIIARQRSRSGVWYLHSSGPKRLCEAGFGSGKSSPEPEHRTARK
jgi:hypothetical protein